MQVKPSISLIIPCYNEVPRLHLAFEKIEAFEKQWGLPYEVVFVDDGSSDGTYEMCQNYIVQSDYTRGQLQAYKLPQNIGKGGALKQGVNMAKGALILTLDADMSAAPTMLLKWLEIENKKQFDSDCIIIGSRTNEKSEVNSKSYRRWAGYLFNFAIKFLTGLPFGDTQCGFKLYPSAYGKTLFSALEELGWAHDIEILLAAQKNGYKTKALPIEWHHVDTDKISVLKDGLNMLLRTIQIRRRLN